VEVEINKKSHCGDVNGKVPALPSCAHSSALQLSYHPGWLQIGLCMVRCTEGGVGKKKKKKEMQAQHANQVFPLLTLGSRDC
jgi:hypothetical protein